MNFASKILLQELRTYFHFTPFLLILICFAVQNKCWITISIKLKNRINRLLPSHIERCIHSNTFSLRDGKRWLTLFFISPNFFPSSRILNLSGIRRNAENDGVRIQRPQIVSSPSRQVLLTFVWHSQCYRWYVYSYLYFHEIWIDLWNLM